ncbi:TPA: hypothetical protein ACH3X1_007663 [Trebouxia sp. C0004]
MLGEDRPEDQPSSDWGGKLDLKDWHADSDLEERKGIKEHLTSITKYIKSHIHWDDSTAEAPHTIVHLQRLAGLWGANRRQSIIICGMA